MADVVIDHDHGIARMWQSEQGRGSLGGSHGASLRGFITIAYVFEGVFEPVNLAVREPSAVYLSAYKEIVSCRRPGNLSNSLALPSGESGRLNRDLRAVSGSTSATLE